MQVEQVHTQTISLETCLTHSSLDESLALIVQFLTTRLTEREEKGYTEAHPPVSIDVGFLSISDSTSDTSERWRHQTVYPIRVHFSTILLGPISNTAQSGGPCPRCLEQRWLANHCKTEEYSVYQNMQQILAGTHRKLHDFALEVLWGIVESDLYGPHPSSEDGRAWFHMLDLDTLQVQRYQLIADSSCPVCAKSETALPRADAFPLVERPKRDISNYRLVDLLDYPLPDKGYVDSMCGMLGTMSSIGLHHTVTASTMGSYDLHGKAVTWAGNHTTTRASQRAGMLEGLERYCGILWPRTKGSTVTASYNALHPNALNPFTCGLYHPDTYRLYATELEPFTEESTIDWVWGYSFRQAQPILVPEQLAYYARRPKQSRHFVLDTSNGCAIGSCLEEAILHGLLELVERDTFLLHWYARLGAPRIDPWSSRNRKTLRLLDRIERLGYDVFFLDTRLDLPFPTITVVGRRRSDGLGKLSVAAGASLDPEDAIRAALCEVAASIPALPENMKTQVEALQPLLEDHTKVRTLDQHALLYGFPEMARHAEFLVQNPCMRPIETVYESWYAEKPRNLDLLADLQYCIERIVGLGIDVIVVDQTSAELEGTGLKVVRVIVPGLIPIDFGWGRHRVFHLSRMSTVPRTAGYQETDFDLSMLNLTPHPFP